MSRMIPTALPADAPRSERSVFEALRDAAGTTEWRVLHSLGFSNSVAGRYGEIDFVVVIPDVGVVCIEVKGGGVRCVDGLWSTSDALGQVHRLRRSPFRQAQEGMWKLIEAIADRFGGSSAEAKCPVGWLVVLPDVDCPPPGTEFARADVLDRNDMRTDIGDRIRRAPSIVARIESALCIPPSRDTRDRIVGFLRPDFERIVLPSADREAKEQRIRSLTEEQYGVLDAISENPVCLVKGPAGTGKTLLALEQARRTAMAGGRVLLSCFNRNLAEWMRQAIGGTPFPEGAFITVGNIHRLLRPHVDTSGMAAANVASCLNTDNEFDAWFGHAALSILDSIERFDTVIVDEVQDMPPDGLAQVAEAWTSDVAGRRIMLFGDFARQAIYGPGRWTDTALRAAFSGVALHGLSLNCRNTRRIVTQTEMLCGLSGTRMSDRQIEGDPVETMFFADRSNALAKLEKIIDTLNRATFAPGDIAILAPERRERTMLNDVDRLGRWHITDSRTQDRSAIRFSTIHAFKGLERPVVILLDPVRGDAEETDTLLYVGMSRARLRLFLLCAEEHREAVTRRTMRSLDGLSEVA